MFELPKSCIVNKFIPKKAFYENINMSTHEKNCFVTDIERITWLYKLAPDTIGISTSESILEIQIFEIITKRHEVPLKALQVINKAVKYPILFVIKYQNEYCFAMQYDKIYTSNWNEHIEFNFYALNLNDLYESMMKIIIIKEDNSGSITELINIVKTKETLKNSIKVLENKISRENQFNRKTVLNIELNRLKKELENM